MGNRAAVDGSIGDCLSWSGEEEEGKVDGLACFFFSRSTNERKGRGMDEKRAWREVLLGKPLIGQGRRLFLLSVIEEFQRLFA